MTTYELIQALGRFPATHRVMLQRQGASRRQRPLNITRPLSSRRAGGRHLDEQRVCLNTDWEDQHEYARVVRVLEVIEWLVHFEPDTPLFVRRVGQRNRWQCICGVGCSIVATPPHIGEVCINTRWTTEDDPK